MKVIRKYYTFFVFFVASLLLYLQFHQEHRLLWSHLTRLFLYGFLLGIGFVIVSGTKWKQPNLTRFRRVVFTLYALGFAVFPYFKGGMAQEQKVAEACYYMPVAESDKVSLHHCQVRPSYQGYYDLICTLTNNSAYDIERIELLMVFKDEQDRIIHQEPLSRSEFILRKRTKRISTSFSVAHLKEPLRWEISATRFRLSRASFETHRKTLLKQCWSKGG